MFQRKAPIHPHVSSEPVIGTKYFGEKTLKELQGDFRDDASFTSSISGFDEESIDYQAVYAMHVFIATAEGQISVIRGEKLKLLDDANAYWWLVKVMKTSEIGYIPAENIETPFERLARFNKYKNTKISSFPLPELTNKTNRTSTTKKVSMERNTSVQSMIQLIDAYDNLISEHIEVKTSSIDDPLCKKQQALSMQPPVRLSDHMLSLGLTQHFIETRGTKQLPLSSLQTAPTAIKSRSRSRHRPACNSSTSPTYSNSATPSAKEHISVLRVFAGNISVKATFNSVLVNENTTAEQLLVLALERFRLLDNQQQQRCDGVEYYITVKVSDGDEITLSPQDKPLAMFHSLNAHLTTPMPSLIHIQSKVQLTRIGVTKSESNNNSDASFGENSVTRFSLNKRIKRINEQDGHFRIKIAYYDEESTKSTKTPITTTATSTSTSRFTRFYHRSDIHQQRPLSFPATLSQQLSTRIEKLIAVPGRLAINALTQLALEKFHIQQHDEGSALNDRSSTNSYSMTLVLQGKEHVLDQQRTIVDIMNDKQLITNGNQDEILFTLKKTPSMLSTRSSRLTTVKHENENETTTLATCSPTYIKTKNDFRNSDISLTSASSSTSSDSSRSLTSPDSNAYTDRTTHTHTKLTTDAILQHIDMALSDLEQNESVISGALIDVSSYGSTYMPELLDRNKRLSSNYDLWLELEN